MTPLRWRSEDDSGTGLVTEAAALLDVPEFELFALAHAWAHGRRPRAARLERTFVAYMFARRVPPWVRQYAREVLAASPRDAKRLGLDRLPREAPPRHGKLAVALTFAAFSVFYLFLLDAYYDPGTSAPAPSGPRPLSCAGGGPGLTAFEKMSYWISGTTRPDC